MAKIAMACPFSNQLCTECAVYRGRHHYLSLSRQKEGASDQEKGHAQSRGLPFSVEFQTLRNSSKTVDGRYSKTKMEPKIRLKVIDMESNAARIWELSELERWDWSNPRIWRIIDGRQVTNLDSLIEILCYKAEHGCEEAELYEAPRFMLLAGG
jgi:hypothetical protein